VSRGALGIWPTLSPLALLRRHRGEAPFPLGDPNLILSACGRHSLWLGLEALGVGEGDEVLTPAYHHGAEVEAIAATGALPRFYAGDDTLEPNADELEGLLGPRVRALHLTHYVGFGQDAARWRDWCSRRGLLLIEDAAQAWLSERDGRPLGSHGDMAIFCLYKSVGTPDGGALVCAAAPKPNQSRSGAGLAALAKLQVRWAAARGLVPARAVIRTAGSFDPAAEFELGDVSAPPSRATKALLSHFDYGLVRERRRHNYERLLERLGTAVPPPFDKLPAGVSPWVFPVRCEAKAGLLDALREARVNPLNFWSEPHPLLDVSAFPAAAERRRTTVGLPVHQDLREHDVERIAQVAGDWVG
jgi:perosamine synthetase